MPIKPENKARYPKDWPQIRERILQRAMNRCEQCKVVNRTRIARGGGKDAGSYQTEEAEVFDATDGRYLGMCRMSDYEVARYVDIVLTIAHLDHTPENCADDNLRALCQRCHLAYDAQHHAANAHATRRSRLAARDLFDLQPEPSNAQ
jgi:hypothetical protein